MALRPKEPVRKPHGIGEISYELIVLVYREGCILVNLKVPKCPFTLNDDIRNVKG